MKRDILFVVCGIRSEFANVCGVVCVCVCVCVCVRERERERERLTEREREREILFTILWCECIV